MAGVVKEVLSISYRFFFLRTVAVEITIIATKVSGFLALVALSISTCRLQSTQGLIHSKNARFVVSKAVIMRSIIWPKREPFLAGPTREIPSGVECDLFLNVTKSREWPCSEIFPIPLSFHRKPALLRNYYKYRISSTFQNRLLITSKMGSVSTGCVNVTPTRRIVSLSMRINTTRSLSFIQKLSAKKGKRKKLKCFCKVMFWSVLLSGTS